MLTQAVQTTRPLGMYIREFRPWWFTVDLTAVITLLHSVQSLENGRNYYTCLSNSLTMRQNDLHMSWRYSLMGVHLFLWGICVQLKAHRLNLAHHIVLCGPPKHYLTWLTWYRLSCLLDGLTAKTWRANHNSTQLHSTTSPIMHLNFVTCLVAFWLHLTVHQRNICPPQRRLEGHSGQLSDWVWRPRFKAAYITATEQLLL